jgi:hypothetical protein
MQNNIDICKQNNVINMEVTITNDGVYFIKILCCLFVCVKFWNIIIIRYSHHTSSKLIN